MRNWLRIVCVNVAALTAGLLVLELVFGGWLRDDALYRLGPLRDVVLHYDVSRIYQTATPQTTYSRDKYGLRGRYGPDPRAIDLLTVGGSTTDQRYITDGQTWQDALQEQFAEAGHPIVIANAGVDGQSTIGHNKAFDWWFPNVPGLKPRYILFYLGINDFYVRERDDAEARFYDPWLAEVRDNSALYYVGRTLWGVYLAEFVFGIGHRKVDFAARPWTRVGLQPDYSFMAAQLGAYARRVNTLVDRTRRLGAEPIFITQPSRYYRKTEAGIEGDATVSAYAGHDINGVDIYRMMRGMDATLEEVRRSRHALFIDLSAESTWDDGDFYDAQHMNPTGLKKLGRYLFADLSPLVTLKAKNAF